MGLLQGLHILLSHTPPVPGAGVELAGAVHGQCRRSIIHDQPFYPIYPGEPWQKVIWIALEDRLHVWLVALKDEGTGADSMLSLFQIAKFFHHFRRYEPHATRVG